MIVHTPTDQRERLDIDFMYVGVTCSVSFCHRQRIARDHSSPDEYDTGSVPQRGRKRCVGCVSAWAQYT